MTINVQENEVEWFVSWNHSELGVIGEFSRGQTAYQAWSRISGAPCFGLCEFEVMHEQH